MKGANDEPAVLDVRPQYRKRIAVAPCRERDQRRVSRVELIGGRHSGRVRLVGRVGRVGQPYLPYLPCLPHLPYFSIVAFLT